MFFCFFSSLKGSGFTQPRVRHRAQRGVVTLGMNANNEIKRCKRVTKEYVLSLYFALSVTRFQRLVIGEASFYPGLRRLAALGV